jgi:hypothetical protein
MNKEAVKMHYEGLLSKFSEAIEGIDIEGLPAVHIPAIGDDYDSGDEKYRRIMIFGMETKYWGGLHNMSDLKSRVKSGNSYEYLTKQFTSLNIFKKVKRGSFFDFIIKFLSKFYEIKAKEDKHILRSFIWGNINSLERRNTGKGKEESDTNEPENWKKVRAKSKEIFDMHLFAATKQFDKYKEDQDQLRYMLENCKPDLLLVLYWDFNFGAWLEKNYGVSWKINDAENHFCYAHIKTDKINTHVYKCAHPRFMKQGQHKNFIEVISRIKKHYEQYKT